jgi:hypothetical protein
MVVFAMGLEMVGQVPDAPREERDLNFRRSRIRLVTPVGANDLTRTLRG